MELQEELVKKITGAKQKIAITCHSSPDGDAIGSSLGLCHFLKTLGHNAKVIAPDNFPNFLKWMPGTDNIIIYSEEVEKAEDIIENVGMVFYLDFNELSRVGSGLQKCFESSNAFKIMIDHHTNPTNIANIAISEPTACSTALLIYQFIEALNKTADISADCATCLYSGILTDTGSFRFASTNATTFKIAAELVEKGAKNAEIYAKIFDNYSENRLRLMGFILKDKLQIVSECRTAIIGITEKELMHYHFKKGDTEGIVNYPLSIADIVLSIIIMEKEGKVKLSLRSKGNFKVNEIAKEYFSGGGHINAAGGISEVSVDETIKKILNFLPDYQAQLNQTFNEIK